MGPGDERPQTAMCLVPERSPLVKATAQRRDAQTTGAEPTAGLDLAELRNASLANASGFADVNASSPSAPHYIRRGR